MVDAKLNRAAKDRAGTFGVAWRTEHAGSSELHRAEADAVDGLFAQKRCLVHAYRLRLFDRPDKKSGDPVTATTRLACGLANLGQWLLPGLQLADPVE